MKLMITWIKKNGNCQSWTNGDLAEHTVMGLMALRSVVDRKAKAENIGFDESFNKLFSEVNTALERAQQSKEKENTCSESY